MAAQRTGSSPLTDVTPVIEVVGLVKEYRLGAMQGLRQMAMRLLGRSGAAVQQFRALDDVSFRIARGEVVGIIGHNGAGKSTLLKLLCNITQPTRGAVRVKGRIAPLIEVGAGLVGDMTGRENIYLNASILGLSRAEIEDKIAGIIAFAELEQFIDTPIKRYSSGMQVRLGFAIATAIDCDILIVDEVLAVGDISFQQKCLDRIESLIHKQACTVVIVGHNIRQLERVCTRLIMMDHGRLIADGSTVEVSSRYFAEAQKLSLHGRMEAFEGLVPQEAADFIEVLAIEMDCGETSGHAQPTLHAPLRFRIRFRCTRELRQPEFVVGVHTPDFVHILSVGNAADLERPSFAVGEHEVCVTISDLPLRPGVYGLRLAILNHLRQIIWNAQNIKAVSVAAGGVSLAHLPEASLVDVAARWTYPTPAAARTPQPAPPAGEAVLPQP